MMTIEQMEQHVKDQEKKMQAATEQNKEIVRDLKKKMERAQDNLQT